MSACICPPTGWLEPECPKHGLPGDTKFPPMDRHARKICRLNCIEPRPPQCAYCRTETAREVQLRLYGAARKQATA